MLVFVSCVMWGRSHQICVEPSWTDRRATRRQQQVLLFPSNFSNVTRYCWKHGYSEFCAFAPAWLNYSWADVNMTVLNINQTLRCHVTCKLWQCVAVWTRLTVYYNIIIPGGYIGDWWDLQQCVMTLCALQAECKVCRGRATLHSLTALRKFSAEVHA